MKIGIDLGGSHIGIGILNEEGKIMLKQEEPVSFQTEKEQDWKPVIRDRILSLIQCVLEKMQIPLFSIKQIGIGIPGIVRDNKIQSCKKYGIGEWDLAEELKAYCKIPIRVQNDAICSAKAERKYGNLQGVKTGVFLCLGTGIGGATILENTIFPSEYGHMVIQKDGKKCHCGKRGCFEMYSSMKAFREGFIERMHLQKDTPSEELAAIVYKQKHNTIVKQYIEEYLDTLLVGISNILSIWNPEVLCLGGSFAYFEDSLYERFLEKTMELKEEIGQTEFKLAKLQNTAGMIGAVLE